jgi:hypothetical protein
VVGVVVVVVVVTKVLAAYILVEDLKQVDTTL